MLSMFLRYTICLPTDVVTGLATAVRAEQAGLPGAVGQGLCSVLWSQNWLVKKFDIGGDETSRFFGSIGIQF